MNQREFRLFKVHVPFHFYGSALLLLGWCLGRLVQEVFQNKSMAGFQSKTLQREPTLIVYENVDDTSPARRSPTSLRLDGLIT